MMNTGIIQSAVAERDLALVHTEQTPVIPFEILGDESGKLAKFYTELGKDEDSVPIYRATVGLGGSKDFNVSTGIEEMDGTTPKITGVIIAARPFNVYFDDEHKGEPPVCTAMDAEHGTNRITGEMCDCADCPRNKLVRGEKKLCRNKVRLYVLTEGTPVPLAIDVPPASLINWKKYKKSLFHLGMLEPHEVLTEFTLTAEMNAQKIKYSKLKMNVAGKLDAEAAEKAAWVARIFDPDEVIVIEDYAVKDGE